MRHDKSLWSFVSDIIISGASKKFPRFAICTAGADLMYNCTYSAILIIKDCLNFVSESNICNCEKTAYQWKLLKLLLGFTKVKWEKITLNFRIKRS